MPTNPLQHNKPLLRGLLCYINVFVLFITLACNGSAAPGELHYDDEISLGRIKAGQSRTVKLSLENTGNSPVRLENIMVGCKCVRVTSEDKLIEPGKLTQLSITYTADKSNIGHTMTHPIIIKSNSVKSLDEIIVLAKVEK